MDSGPMPIGRVAFFFTDLESSTRQWEAQPELMHLAVSRHDDLMVDLIQRRNGVVFSTAGDSFAAVFPNVHDAVTAASEIQRALAAEPWIRPIDIKARMAIHVGVANLRGGNYFGSAVNRAARIMATGHGGQLLLSDDARGECPDLDVIDLGLHYLKDLSAPEHVWQVTIDGLGSDFPPLRSLDRMRANLPIQLSNFVGRSTEIADVLGLLESNRLITLRGLGGIGKTRLSLQIAAEAVGQSVEKVCFVGLSPLADNASLPFHVLKALGLAQPSGQTAVETIATSVGSSSTLIVMDNCEHLDGVPDLTAALLAACPNLRVLATSRAALGLAGERVYAIESLPSGAHDSPAEQMFIARALAANARIEFGGEREAVVSRICRRLDGIPLAIELAAARVRSMPPEEIERHLDERFRLLRSTKGFDERHRVLYDTLEWSYQHLEPELQILLRRLSVFAGHFTAADALEVVSSSEGDLLAMSDQLDELVDHSMVVVDVSADVAEYRLLDTVREFGDTALGDERESLHAAHAHHFAKLSRRLFDQMLSPDEAAAVQRRDRAHDDIRAAFMWSRAHDRVDLVADIVARAAIDVLMHRRIEVAVWAADAFEHLDLSSLTIADRCCLYQTAASLEINEGRIDRARDLIGRAEALSLELAPEEIPADLVGGSSIYFFLGLLADGDAIAERLSARLSSLGPSTALAIIMISRSNIHGYSGRPDSARELSETALAMLAGDDVPTWRTLAEWQISRYSNIDPIELSERVARYRDRYLRVRNPFLAATASRQLIGLDSARATAQSHALAKAVDGMSTLSLADPREALGWMMQSVVLLLRAAQYRSALSILAWEQRHRVTPVHPDQLAAIERLMPAARDALGDDELDAIAATLASSTLREAIDFTKAALTEASRAVSEPAPG